MCEVMPGSDDPLTDAVAERLEECPEIRPEAVARGRAWLVTGTMPSGDELARSMIERLVAERVPERVAEPVN